MEILNLLKLPEKNIETLSQRKNMEETFSPSQDMRITWVVVESYLESKTS